MTEMALFYLVCPLDSQFGFRFLFILLEQKAESDLEELDKFREGHFEGLWFKGSLQSTAQHKGRLTTFIW